MGSFKLARKRSNYPPRRPNRKQDFVFENKPSDEKRDFKKKEKKGDRLKRNGTYDKVLAEPEHRMS